MIHEVIVTTISNEGIVHIAPMGIRFIDKQVVISPFKPSTTLNNITENNIATINFIDVLYVEFHSQFQDSTLSKITEIRENNIKKKIKSQAKPLLRIWH